MNQLRHLAIRTEEPEKLAAFILTLLAFARSEKVGFGQNGQFKIAVGQMKTSSFMTFRGQPTFSDLAKAKSLNIKSGEFLGFLGSYSQMPELVHERLLSFCDDPLFSMRPFEQSAKGTA